MKSEALGIDPEELLEHTAWMNRLAKRLVLGADRVDDLVQEAWAAALAKPPSEEIPLRAWLAGVMRKRALFVRRSEGRLKDRESQAAVDRDRSGKSSVPSAAELTARADQQRMLLGHVNELPEHYREVLLLRFFEDMKPAAIAEHLELPVNTVSTRLQRALESLRHRLDQQHAGDRQAWSLALMPLAILDRTASGWLSILTSNAIGVWIMTQPIKAIALTGILVLAGVGYWQLSADPVLDLRQHTTAAEAADLLFAPKASRKADPSGRREAVQPEGRIIKGRVLDTGGLAVEGAKIDRASPPVFDPSVMIVGGRMPSNHSWMTSAADGSFEGQLELGGSLPWLEAFHPAYISLGKVQVKESEPDTVLRMAPLSKTTLVVEVIEAGTGRLVPRYHLFASIQPAKGFQRERKGWPKLADEVLGGRGEYEVAVVEDMPLRVQIDVLGLHEGIDSAQLRQVVEPVVNGVTLVRFELDLDAPEREPNLTVAFGRVVDDETGEPVAGAEVSVHPLVEESGNSPSVYKYGAQTRRVQSFADGRFRIAIEAGGPTAVFSVHHPLYQHYGPKDLQSNPRSMFKGVDEVVIRLSKRGSIRGLLIDASGQPMPGVPLLCIGDEPRNTPATFEFETGEHWRKTTDAEGHFDLTGLHDRRYHVFVLRSPSDPDEKAVASASYMLEPGENREVVLQVDAPERVLVRGRVIPPTPLDYDLVPYFLPYEDGSGWTQPKVSRDGYAAGGLKRGKYLVLLAPAIDDHHGPYALIPEVVVDAFGEQVMDFRYPTGSLSGSVFGQGLPADPHVVALPVVPPGFAHDLLASRKHAQLFSVPLDADGSFRIEQLAPGTYRLELFAGGSPVQSVPIAEQEVVVHGQTQIAPWQVAR